MKLEEAVRTEQNGKLMKLEEAVRTEQNGKLSHGKQSSASRTTECSVFRQLVIGSTRLVLVPSPSWTAGTRSVPNCELQALVYGTTWITSARSASHCELQVLVCGTTMATVIHTVSFEL